MRLPAATITLGGEAWTIRPLTVAQVQAIEPLLFAAGGREGGTIGSAVAILRLALGRDHADAAGRLDDMEAGAQEIAAAMAQVLHLGGFLPHGDAALGEVGAGLPPAETGSAPTGPDSRPA